MKYPLIFCSLLFLLTACASTTLNQNAELTKASMVKLKVDSLKGLVPTASMQKKLNALLQTQADTQTKTAFPSPAKSFTLPISAETGASQFEGDIISAELSDNKLIFRMNEMKIFPTK